MLIPFQWVVAFCQWNATSRRRAGYVHSLSSVRRFTSVFPAGNTPVSYLLSPPFTCFSIPHCLFHPLMKLFVTSFPCMFGKKGFSGKFGRFLKSLLPYRWKLPLSSLTGKCRGTVTIGSSMMFAALAHLGFTVSRTLCCSFFPFPLSPLLPLLFLDGSVTAHFLRNF